MWVTIAVRLVANCCTCTAFTLLVVSVLDSHVHGLCWIPTMTSPSRSVIQLSAMKPGRLLHLLTRSDTLSVGTALWRWRGKDLLNSHSFPFPTLSLIPFPTVFPFLSHYQTRTAKQWSVNADSRQSSDRKAVTQKTGHQSLKNNCKTPFAQYCENQKKIFMQLSFKMLCQLWWNSVGLVCSLVQQ